MGPVSVAGDETDAKMARFPLVYFFPDSIRWPHNTLRSVQPHHLLFNSLPLEQRNPHTRLVCTVATARQRLIWPAMKNQLHD